MSTKGWEQSLLAAEVNDRKARTPARDAGFGDGWLVAKCLLLRGVVGCG